MSPSYKETFISGYYSFWGTMRRGMPNFNQWLKIFNYHMTDEINVQKSSMVCSDESFKFCFLYDNTNYDQRNRFYLVELFKEIE